MRCALRHHSRTQGQGWVESQAAFVNAAFGRLFCAYAAGANVGKMEVCRVLTRRGWNVGIWHWRWVFLLEISEVVMCGGPCIQRLECAEPGRCRGWNVRRCNLGDPGRCAGCFYGNFRGWNVVQRGGCNVYLWLCGFLQIYELKELGDAVAVLLQHWNCKARWVILRCAQ